MFTDPQSITVDSVAQSMPRISSNGQQAIYVKADESYKMTISHTKPKGRIRSMVRVDFRAVVADPLTSVNDYETLSFYCVIDRPEVGFTNTQVVNLITGFKTWLDSTAIGKVYGQES
jgi:hypothetical protein